MVGMLKHYNVGNNTLFSAMQTRLANRSSEAFAEEERQDKANGLTNIAALMRANNVRVSDRIDNIEDSVAVMFNDPKTNQRITLNLSNENLNRLKGQFGADNFYAREDGVIRLNGKAEAFVSGWFGDVAYQQNFAEADKDKNGRVAGSELQDIKSTIVTFVYDETSATDVAMDRYVKGAINNLGSNDFLETIEEQLNVFLEMDKNFDGNIEELVELYNGDLQQLIYDIDEIIFWAERNVFNHQIEIPDKTQPKDTSFSIADRQSGKAKWEENLDKLKKLREQLDEQAEEAKERLEQNGKDDSATIEIPKSLETQTESQPNDEAKEVINAELAPVVEEIASKVASNDVQLFEVKI